MFQHYPRDHVATVTNNLEGTYSILNFSYFDNLTFYNDISKLLQTTNCMPDAIYGKKC